MKPEMLTSELKVLMLLDRDIKKIIINNNHNEDKLYKEQW